MHTYIPIYMSAYSQRFTFCGQWNTLKRHRSTGIRLKEPWHILDIRFSDPKASPGRPVACDDQAPAPAQAKAPRVEGAWWRSRWDALSLEFASG